MAGLTDDLRDEGLGPDELAEAAELAKRVRGAVQALPRGQRQAVLAFYWQGLSHTEAAAELAVSPGAIKARFAPGPRRAGARAGAVHPTSKGGPAYARN